MEPPTNRFTDLLPLGWSETLKETLDYIKNEAEHHPTELWLDSFMERNEDNPGLTAAVAKLRARAVVLAHAVEYYWAEGVP